MSITRMHSSRMRTGRSLTICCSLLPGGGGFSLQVGGRGVSLVPGGFFLVPGGLPAGGREGGLLGPGGGVCLVLGGSPWSGGGLPGPGGVLPGLGGSPWCRGGGSPWSGGFSGDPPPVDRITDTCKNITLATTSLRPVIIITIFIFHCRFWR